ncbi:MAG: helix-turn-helix domain-containing protein [Oscillospiraceae bacterium]|nr:helix-turn-helix domain-containing protein [Oscillospiraceae bacterium]
MDCMKTGRLIAQLRKEKGLTQKNIADALGIQNKTVSKWECGLGAPDTSLLSDLAVILGVDTRRILEGEIRPNRPDNGNMARTKFYICPVCGNIMFSSGSASMFCCGRKLEPVKAEKCEDGLSINIEHMDAEWFISFNHPMEKDNYMMFAACVKGDVVYLNRFYPQQSPQFSLPDSLMGRLYLYSTSMGMVDAGTIKEIIKKQNI